MASTQVQRISRLERRASSPNGNPTYEVHFTDGTSARTATDASVAYGIANSENLNTDLTVTYDDRGRIIHVQPVTP